MGNKNILSLLKTLEVKLRYTKVFKTKFLSSSVLCCHFNCLDVPVSDSM